MGYATIILIALGLSMDSLAVCISGGIFMKKFCIRKSLKMAFIMGGFQGGMTLLGWALGINFSKYISDYDHWIAFLLLSYLGGKMIYESFKAESSSFSSLSDKTLLTLGVATSIDALAVGISFAFLKTGIFLPVLIIVQLWMSMGISFLSFIAGMQTVDVSLYEAGMMDGIKNRFQELWYITLPAMVPQLLFGAIMQIISAFTVADVSVQLAGLPSTNYAGETIVTHIMDYGSIRYEFGYACAMSVVLVLLMQGVRALVTKMLSKVGT